MPKISTWFTPESKLLINIATPPTNSISKTGSQSNKHLSYTDLVEFGASIDAAVELRGAEVVACRMATPKATMRLQWLTIQVLVVAMVLVKEARSLKTCEYPAVYGFGDSLIDVGNSIAALPNQFAGAELDPNGVFWPLHSADRLSDGKLFVDFVSSGVSLGPTYPYLRSTATNPMWGTNFAASGASTTKQTTRWSPNSGFNTPFSLNVQLQWLHRYKVQLAYYYKQTYVKQELPAYDTLNASMYVVQAGFQDYFFPLYDKKATTQSLLDKVESVVSAIAQLIDGLVAFGATEILTLNLIPLGCTPALLTLYPGTPDKYNQYGCLQAINDISTKHNKALGEKMVTLRSKYPTIKLYFADMHAVYIDILKSPHTFNVTEPLKACCGAGGQYNFNKQVTCTGLGTVGGLLVNLTAPCKTPLEHLSWDGIHTSHKFNRVAAGDFFSGKHITPTSFGCAANTSRWDTHA